MAPVVQVVPTPNVQLPSHNPTFTSSSPPPIKSYQSTSTIHSSGFFQFPYFRKNLP